MSSPEPIRILFYPHSARAFSSSLIGHLAELSRDFSVVLLTESLHPSYARILEDRSLFPNLVRVEYLPRPGYSVLELVCHNRKWHRLAQGLVREIRPQVVVTENDMSSLLDMYLLRAAKKSGAACLTIQGMAQIADTKMQRFIELSYIYRGYIEPGPSQRLWRTMKYRSRKWLGHFLVHYLMPWSLGTRALRGDSSYVLRKGASGLRDSDLNLVPTLQAWQAHTDSGVPDAKLALLPHPLTRVSHGLYFVDLETTGLPTRIAPRPSVLVLLTSVPTGFRSHDYSLIDRQRRRQTRLDILRLVRQFLPAWQILVKPHPDCGTLEEVRQYLADVNQEITLLPPSVPVEPYLKDCDAIIDLPLSVTTTLFTAACAFPKKPIISANVDDEFYGDLYRGFPGVDYVASMAELKQLLQEIADGSYRKPAVEADDEEGGLLKFATANDAVRYLLSRS